MLTCGRCDCNKIIGSFYSVAKPGHCPAVDIHHVGVCKSECSSDRDCRGDRKCCSNGCGRICSAPVQQGKHTCIEALPGGGGGGGSPVACLNFKMSCVINASGCCWKLSENHLSLSEF